MRPKKPKKPKNPFADCANFQDVSSVLRKLYEKLRGKRVNRWEVYGPHVSDGRLFQATVRADNTRISNSHWGLDWVEVLLGEALPGRRGDLPARIRRWDGKRIRPYLSVSGGHGDGVTWTAFVSISLKHLPKIRAVVRQNDLAMKRRDVRGLQYPLTPDDKKIMEAAKALQDRVDSWRAAISVALAKKYPVIDLDTERR